MNEKVYKIIQEEVQQLLKEQGPPPKDKSAGLFMRFIFDYPLTPVTKHELLMRALKEVNSTKTSKYVDKERAIKTLKAMLAKNKPVVEKQVEDIRFAMKQDFGAQQKKQKPEPQEERSQYRDTPLHWYWWVAQIRDYEKEWVFAFWELVSRPYQRHKEHGLCKFVTTRKAETGGEIGRTQDRWPNKETHPETYEYYKKRFPELPERGLTIPMGHKSMCDMSLYQLDVRRVQQEFVGQYCVVGDWKNQPCDIRILGEIFYDVFAPVLNKDVFEFFRSKSINPLGSGTGWTWEAMRDASVSELALKEIDRPPDSKISQKVGPSRAKGEDPMDVPKSIYKKEWMMNYIFKSPTFRKALNESFQAKCEELVAEMKTLIETDLPTATAKGPKQRYPEDQSAAADVKSFISTGSAARREMIHSPLAMQTKLAGMQTLFLQYKTYLMSMVSEEYRLDLDKMSRKEGEKWEKNDPLYELHNVLDKKFKTSWDKPLWIGNPRMMAGVTKTPLQAPKIPHAAADTVQKYLEKYREYMDQKDFDLQTGYKVMPPRRETLVRSNEIIDQDYLDGFEKWWAYFTRRLTSRHNLKPMTRIAAINPNLAARKHFTSTGDWPTWGDFYKSTNSGKYKSYLNNNPKWNIHTFSRTKAHQELRMCEGSPDREDCRAAVAAKLRRSSGSLPRFQLRALSRTFFANEMRRYGPGRECSADGQCTQGRICRPVTDPRCPLVKNPKTKKMERRCGRCVIDPKNPDSQDFTRSRKNVEKFIDDSIKEFMLFAALETVTTPIAWMTPFKRTKELRRPTKWSVEPGAPPRTHYVHPTGEATIGGGRAGGGIDPAIRRTTPGQKPLLRGEDIFEDVTTTLGEKIFAANANLIRTLVRYGGEITAEVLAKILSFFVSTSEARMLEGIMRVAKALKLPALGSFAAFLMEFASIMAVFVAAHRVVVTPPEFRDRFLQTLGGLTPINDVGQMDALLGWFQTNMSEDEIKFKSPLFKKQLANLQGMLSNYTNMLNSQTHYALMSRWGLYCGKENWENATDEDWEAYAGEKDRFGEFRDMPFCKEDFNENNGKAMAAHVIQEAISKIEGTYIAALTGLKSENEKFTLYRYGFDHFKAHPTPKFFEELKAKYNKMTKGLCVSSFAIEEFSTEERMKRIALKPENLIPGKSRRDPWRRGPDTDPVINKKRYPKAYRLLCVDGNHPRCPYDKNDPGMPMP